MGKKNRRGIRPGEWGLFAASSAVLLVGLALTAAVWTGLTRLLRHHWPWDRHLERVSATTSQLDVTKVALSVVAGVGAAIALTVTYRRQRDIERARFDERLAAGAAQLGANSAAQRLAGVHTYFDSARFVGGNVSFDGAQFTGATIYFNHAQFTGATVYFNETRFANGTTRFSDAHFAKGLVHFDEVMFASGNVNFKRVEFAGAEVTFHNAKYVDGNVYFTGATFTGGTVNFGSAGGPTSPDASRSIVSFQGTQGVPGVANLGDLQGRVGQVTGPDGHLLTQPELFD